MSLISPVLVGRRAESDILAQAVEGARRREGSAVFLVGEPGIGKSRLAAEAAVAATESGVRLLRGRAASGGSAVPFRPLTEAVFSALRGEGAPGSADLGPYWPVLSRLAPMARPQEPDESAAMDDSLVVRAESVLRLLAVLGEAKGCILLLEDLHDADADTLAVVDYLLDNVERQPVLLLATLRPHHGPALELANAAAERRTAEILRLSRLTATETSQLTARCLGSPLDAVPAVALARLQRDADGVPFVVEELLNAMVEGGSLVRHGNTWRVDGTIDGFVPATVSAAILQRVERLDPQCVALLEAAAVLGNRFSVRIAASIAGLDPEEAFQLLGPAARAQLIAVDSSGDPEWQSFRHALTADAILQRLLPGERAALSRAAASAVEAATADLGDDRSQLAAELWAAGGNHPRAAALLAEAGRLATARGALMTAVELLDRGVTLIDSAPDTPPSVVADVLETLVRALVMRGDAARVRAISPRLDEALVAAGAAIPRRVAAYLARARASAAAGQWDAGLAEVASARALIGENPDPILTAPADAVAAHLVLGAPRHDRIEAAAELANRAVKAAALVPLPEVECEALLVLGTCVRRQDLMEAQEIFERALAIAEKHRLAIWRLRALLEIGVLDKLRSNEKEGLLAAQKVAEATGAIITMAWVDLHLSTVYGMRGKHDQAIAYAQRAADLARQLRMRELELLAGGARAGIAAARGRRSEMEELLQGLSGGSAYMIGYGADVWGWVLGMCSLVEEDHDRALAEFEAAARAESAVPSTRASGYRGPYLLLRTIRGLAGWSELDDFVASHLPQVHPHRPYLAWSRAVLLGREGDHEAATKAALEAEREAEVLLLTRYLGLRLVAEVALAGGWGEPVRWLRESEEYFHSEDVPRVAAACRALLRKAGAHLPQRRSSQDAIPDELRRLGVTIREYEVLRLLADRRGNREIAEHLFLSPRTVEKHIASLRARFGEADRARLVEHARRYVEPD
jgi:ATP/maltotriose-dependent transcriptional regulator MalT